MDNQQLSFLLRRKFRDYPVREYIISTMEVEDILYKDEDIVQYPIEI